MRSRWNDLDVTWEQEAMRHTESHWSKERAEALLSQGYWFGALPEAMQRSIIDRCEIRSFKSNCAIYHIGDMADGMYAVLEGDIRAYAYSDNRKRILLRLIAPTSWFGNFHLIDDYPTRGFEVRAHSKCTGLFLSKKNYHEIADGSLENYRHFVKLVCIQQRFLLRVELEAHSNIPRRVVRALIRIAKIHGCKIDVGIQVTLNITQSDLASLIGVSRLYLNELISAWNDAGFVIWKGKAAPVVFIDKLKTLLSPLDQRMLKAEGWL
jgi:CRP/FNR family cyclic AMP-dependent transcriptional regulator